MAEEGVKREVVNHVRRLEAGWCGRVFGGTRSDRGRGAPCYRQIVWYVCMVITYSKVWINRVRLPILLVVS